MVTICLFFFFCAETERVVQTTENCRLVEEVKIRPIDHTLVESSLWYGNLCKTRRMFVIVAASRACKIVKITFFTKRSKVRKSDHAFLPEGIQIEDL